MQGRRQSREAHNQALRRQKSIIEQHPLGLFVLIVLLLFVLEAQLQVVCGEGIVMSHKWSEMGILGSRALETKSREVAALSGCKVFAQRKLSKTDSCSVGCRTVAQMKQLQTDRAGIALSPSWHLDVPSAFAYPFFEYYTPP